MKSRDVFATKSWTTRRERKKRRLLRVAGYCDGRVIQKGNMVAAMEELLEPGDRVCLEGNNQKQADFLSRMLAEVNPARIHSLHLLISALSRPEHLDLFERKVANRVDFSFSGPQAVRLAEMVSDGRIQIGAIHTYLELFGRYFVDLTPDVSFIAADSADNEGNLYTGANTEETPLIAEATAFRDGVVVAQVNEIRKTIPRVDIPDSWVDLIVVADRPYAIEPLFTRDPALITDVQILMAMLVIRGIYEKHSVRTLNHGIGFDTAAIELLLPTYGESLGLRGKICTHWVLNPHPTLIPAIESGWFVCRRSVYWLHIANGRASKFLDSDCRPNRWFWGCAEYGKRPTWPAPSYTCLAGDDVRDWRPGTGAETGRATRANFPRGHAAHIRGDTRCGSSRPKRGTSLAAHHDLWRRCYARCDGRGHRIFIPCDGFAGTPCRACGDRRSNSTWLRELF